MPYCKTCEVEIPDGKKFCSQVCYYKGQSLVSNKGRFSKIRPPSGESRKKAAETRRVRYKVDPGFYRLFIEAGQREETRVKARERGWGKKKGEAPVCAGWGKGFTKATHPSVASQAEKLHQLGLSENSFYKNPEYRKKISERQRGKNNSRYRWFANASEEERQAWRKKMRLGLLVKPTRPELLLMEIINRFDLPYRYVGDGNFWISRINPDFVNINGAKIVLEVFGDYWHTMPGAEEEDDRKTEVLRSFGWKKIVVWESQLEYLSAEQIVNVIAEQGG